MSFTGSRPDSIALEALQRFVAAGWAYQSLASEFWAKKIVRCSLTVSNMMGGERNGPRKMKLNYTMKRTRVAPAKDSKSARKSLALFELCMGLRRAVYLGR
jgi:hypothetical protein